MEIKKVDLEKVGPLLLEIDNRVFIREFDRPSKDVKEEIKYLKGSEVYVVYEKDRPVGFFAYKFDEAGVEIKTMAVIPGYQGKGIGRVMMEKLLQLTKGKFLRLVTHPQNTQAIVFYLKSGFKICGWANNYFGDGQPRLKLEKKN